MVPAWIQSWILNQWCRTLFSGDDGSHAGTPFGSTFENLPSSCEPCSWVATLSCRGRVLELRLCSLWTSPQPMLGQATVLRSSHLFSTWGSLMECLFSGAPGQAGWDFLIPSSHWEVSAKSCFFLPFLTWRSNKPCDLKKFHCPVLLCLLQSSTDLPPINLLHA